MKSGLFALCFILLAASPPRGSEASLTQAHAYACEIQAYLIKVVLGLEGPPSMRQKWSEKGLEERLQFRAIYEAMHGGESSELRYMLLDYNLADLMKVLYYYDPDLNLHGKSLGILSPYPSPEFLAMRLFLLKRLHSSKPLSLGALLGKEGLLTHSLGSPDRQRIMNNALSQEEAAFLSDVVASQPRILEYMKCPFLVRSLMEAKILAADPFAEERASQASYGPLGMAVVKGDASAARKIVFLPSFTRHFDLVQGVSGSDSIALKASDELYRLASKLANTITDRAAGLASEGNRDTGTAALNFILKDTVFLLEKERPLAIYPGNAREAIDSICPEATLTVIILDKNVRLALHGLHKPSNERPWIFIDAMDIAYGQLGEEIDAIAAFLTSGSMPEQ